MPHSNATNRTKSDLRNGKTIYVPEINRVFHPVVVELIAQAGFTCVWFDMEHTQLDLETLSNMILAARTVDLDVVVRIPHGPYNNVIKPLELGAGGLIWPHCKSADEARAFVKMSKFQPQGLRGIGAGRDSGFGTAALSDFLPRANEQTLLGVMIEDAEGVDNSESIAAVDGIDLLFVGPGDLAHSYNVLVESNPPHLHERILEAFERVERACRANGKCLGTAVNPGEAMAAVVERRVKWLNCGTDLGAVREGYREALRATREIV